MTEVLTTTDSFVAVLVDEDDEDLPLRVRGIALGENDVTYGNEQTQIRWPKEVLEAATSSLKGTKIVDPSEHWAPDGGALDDDYPRDPPEETWVGEITDVTYKPGLGPMYEGEITDPDMAELVREGDVEPSPTVFHERAEVDPENWVATGVTKWRDLAMVDNGASEGASIEPDDGPAAGTATNGVAAMSEGEVVAALSAAFGDGDESVAVLASLEHLQHSGTSGGKLDESAIPSDSFKSHYMFPGDSKSDSSFPVVDAEGNLRRGNVSSAWDLRGHAPVGEEEVAKMLRTLAKNFDDPPVTEEDVSSLGDGGGDESDSTDSETAGAESPVDSDTPAVDTMDLTDNEEDLIRRARTLDTPTVVEDSVASLGEEASQHEDPEILDGEDYDSLTATIERVEEFFGNLLAEQRGLREETVASMGAESLMGEFENDEGDLDEEEMASALSQEPEAGGSGGEDEETADPDPSPDEEGEDVEEQISALEQKREALKHTAAAPRLDEKIAALKEGDN